MSDHDSSPSNARAHALARLAALQRLRDEAKNADRKALVRALEQMMAQEAKALRDTRKPGAETRPR